MNKMATMSSVSIDPVKDLVDCLVKQMSEREPFYEGKDPHLQEKPWCATCNRRPKSGLLCCSRCHAAWYCNSICQKAHYKL
jgi:hypothetical protein